MMLRLIIVVLLSLVAWATMQPGKHWPAAMKEQFLMNWTWSGLSLRAFCRQHDPPVPYSTAHDWKTNNLAYGNNDSVKDLIGIETRGRNRILHIQDIAILINIVAQHPTYFLFEIQQELNVLAGKWVSIRTIWLTFKRLHINRIKITKLSCFEKYCKCEM